MHVSSCHPLIPIISVSYPSSPAAPRSFSEVVNAYETLSDEKKRANYNMKRKFTNPFRRDGTAGGGGSSGRARTGSGGGGGAAGSGAAWGRSTYNAAREEATRRWKEQNPTPDEIGERDWGGIVAKGQAERDRDRTTSRDREEERGTVDRRTKQCTARARDSQKLALAARARDSQKLALAVCLCGRGVLSLRFPSPPNFDRCPGLSLPWCGSALEVP